MQTSDNLPKTRFGNLGKKLLSFLLWLWILDTLSAPCLSSLPRLLLFSLLNFTHLKDIRPFPLWKVPKKSLPAKKGIPCAAKRRSSIQPWGSEEPSTKFRQFSAIDGSTCRKFHSCHRCIVNHRHRCWAMGILTKLRGPSPHTILDQLLRRRYPNR